MDENSSTARRVLDPGVDHLDEGECWRYLSVASFGRLAVVDDDGRVDIFPVNHAVDHADDHDSLVLRTADGAKLRALASGREIAYEVDGVTGSRSWPRTAWSVVLRGRAETITDLAGLAVLRSVAVAPWQGGSKSNVVRLSGSVSGRRFAVTGSGWWS
ncbi:pyridoxamine 5'-phosphate oxidase family protein [Kineococcus sp. R86509]|uniref:pyridoxamine 5'-phosphate oxidase family protein n=1 Tax=Kineococcus sp. R86509 TaxID=3093851 RepID=UPI0036D23413